jgi:hypothetical protein
MRDDERGVEMVARVALIAAAMSIVLSALVFAWRWLW